MMNTYISKRKIKIIEEKYNVVIPFDRGSFRNL